MISDPRELYESIKWQRLGPHLVRPAEAPSLSQLLQQRPGQTWWAGSSDLAFASTGLITTDPVLTLPSGIKLYPLSVTPEQVRGGARSLASGQTFLGPLSHLQKQDVLGAPAGALRELPESLIKVKEALSGLGEPFFKGPPREETLVDGLLLAPLAIVNELVGPSAKFPLEKTFFYTKYGLVFLNGLACAIPQLNQFQPGLTGILGLIKQGEDLYALIHRPM